jgi:hypothetical protein
MAAWRATQIVIPDATTKPTVTQVAARTRPRLRPIDLGASGKPVSIRLPPELNKGGQVDYGITASSIEDLGYND